MRTTGIIRKIDSLGRLVIPKEIRDNLLITRDTNLEYWVKDDCIILKKQSSTNFDKIHSLSISELADFLNNIKNNYQYNNKKDWEFWLYQNIL